jgi:hypothetical protein
MLAALVGTDQRDLAAQENEQTHASMMVTMTVVVAMLTVASHCTVARLPTLVGSHVVAMLGHPGMPLQLVFHGLASSSRI